MHRLLSPAAVIAALLISQTVAEQHAIKFYFDPFQVGYNCSFIDGKAPLDCAGGSTTAYGGCGFVQDASLTWCCVASGFQDSRCWGLAQPTCVNGSPTQISCSAKTADGFPYKWCCDGAFETCAKNGVCISKFVNPVGPYPADRKDYSAADRDLFATTVYTAEVTGTTFFSMYPTTAPTVQVLAASSTSPARFADTAAATSTPTSTPTPSPTPKATSTGAAVGGAIGGTLAVVGVVFAIIFFLRRRKRTPDETPAPMKSEYQAQADSEIDGLPHYQTGQDKHHGYELPDSRSPGAELGA